MLNTEIAAKIDLSDAAALNRKAASLATVTDATVNVMLASLFFVVGAADKAAKANALRDMKPAFAAFANRHWSEGTGRKALSEKSYTAYASAFGAYGEAGFHPGYDAKPVAEFALGLKGSFTSRGKTLRAILKAHPTTLPTAEQMAEFVKAKEAETPRKVGAAIEKRIDDAFGTEGDHAIGTENVALRLAYVDMRAAVSAFVAALPADQTVAKSFAAEAAELRAKINQ